MMRSLDGRLLLQRWMLLLLLLLLCAWVLRTNAQQNMPFSGQGEEPKEETTVYVSAYIDRLMYIDDRNYEFQGLVFVYLSWRDPRARLAVDANRARMAANSSESCKMQCQLYPQNQPNPVSGCCDNVWLPYVSFSTLKYLSQDRVMRWGVNVEPKSDAVAYWSIILGTFMASFDLKAFPFDAQRLHVQMEIPGWAGGNVRLKPSGGGTRMFNTNPDGDALSGWKVKAVRMATYNLSLCQRYTVASSQPSAIDDPAPLVSSLLYTDKRIQRRPGACAAVLGENKRDPSFNVYTRQNLDNSTELEDAPLNVTGVTCTIVIERYVAQWVMSAILPIVASTWLGFAVFLLPRDCMNSRLGAVMTIFVAVAAIQFVLSQDLPNSSYMTALQQLIAAGYVMLILIGMESVIIWWLTTYHQTGKRLAQHQAAQRQYQAGLKSELDTLKVKLAAMLAEQEKLQGPKKGLSGSFAGMRALSMRKQPRKVQRVGSGSTGYSTSSNSTDERTSAAALAVAAADRTEQQLPASRSSPVVDAGLQPAHMHLSDASSDVAGRQGASDQIKQAQAVLGEVNKLEQQLAELKRQQELQQAVERTTRGVHVGFGALEQPASFSAGQGTRSLGQPSRAAPQAAAAADGAVLLDVGADQADNTEDVRGGCCQHWRVCTRLRVYLSALRQDETLLDQLAYQFNKWLAILQFVAYNCTVVLIFVVNWALYHKS